MKFYTPHYPYFKQKIDEEVKMEPKDSTIDRLLQFAACYHVEKTKKNQLIEIFLN